jgi:hypothetical protein
MMLSDSALVGWGSGINIALYFGRGAAHEEDLCEQHTSDTRPGLSQQINGRISRLVPCLAQAQGQLYTLHGQNGRRLPITILN